jgi:hypothetical protein
VKLQDVMMVWLTEARNAYIVSARKFLGIPGTMHEDKREVSCEKGE